MLLKDGCVLQDITFHTLTYSIPLMSQDIYRATGETTVTAVFVPSSLTNLRSTVTVDNVSVTIDSSWVKGKLQS